MKIRILCGFAAGILLGFASGCSLLPTPSFSKTNYYDLTIPEQIQLSSQIEITPFATQSGDRFKMSTRTGESIVSGNDFHKWILPPGPLVTKYLRLAFRDDPENDGKGIGEGFSLGGAVILFEQQNNTAELGVHYEITYRKQVLKKTVLITEKVEGSGPEHFSRAMSRAAQRLATLIASECRLLESRTRK